jgi:disulfide oxidoreductase YuzD
MKNLNGLNNKVKEIEWLPDLEEHNYPAAESYLTLLYSHKKVAKMMALFRLAAIVQFKAKDIFRASQLSLLGVSNSHVEKDREKILKGKGLSPLLLLRDQQNGKVVIADGYHRLCAIYEFNEDAVIQCKII